MSGDKGLLTCITCRVVFRDASIQRDHYKSDWHRYNLKRKVIELEPVTAENFAERVALQEANQVNESKDTSSYYCSLCRKSYGSTKAYSNHINSKKHLQLSSDSDASNPANAELNNLTSPEIEVTPEPVEVRRGKKFPPPLVKTLNPKPLQKLIEPIEDDDDDEDWDEVEGTPIPINHCLFCDNESLDYESNLAHMSRSHSFFIPDVEYCTDVEGLLEYLGAKVGEGIVCLWCNEKGKQFYDVKSVQQHMRDKGHCKLLHDGDAVFEYTDYYDYSGSYPEGADANPDEAYQLETLHFNDNMQLVLPSGVTLGHRALRMYYKQYIRPGAQVMVHRSTKKNSILNTYRAIGYGSTTLADAQRKYRDQKIFKHARDKYYMKLGVAGNKTTQHHFRRQVQF